MLALQNRCLFALAIVVVSVQWILHHIFVLQNIRILGSQFLETMSFKHNRNLFGVLSNICNVLFKHGRMLLQKRGRSWLKWFNGSETPLYKKKNKACFLKRNIHTNKLLVYKD